MWLIYSLFLSNLSFPHHCYSLQVNTTARIETTGAKNKIHVSEDTAKILQNAGKGHWLVQRETRVHAKGKGELQTYWLDMKSGPGSTATSISGGGSLNGSEGMDLVKVKPASNKDAETVKNEEKLARLVSWTTEMLANSLKGVVARRNAANKQRDPESVLDMLENKFIGTQEAINEVKEVIDLPQFDAEAAEKTVSASQIELDEQVMVQLHDYVRTIAALYHGNAFHNFEVCPLCDAVAAYESMMISYPFVAYCSCYYSMSAMLQCQLSSCCQELWHQV